MVGSPALLSWLVAAMVVLLPPQRYCAIRRASVRAGRLQCVVVAVTWRVSLARAVCAPALLK